MTDNSLLWIGGGIAALLLLLLLLASGSPDPNTGETFEAQVSPPTASVLEAGGSSEASLASSSMEVPPSAPAGAVATGCSSCMTASPCSVHPPATPCRTVTETGFYGPAPCRTVTETGFYGPASCRTVTETGFYGPAPCRSIPEPDPCAPSPCQIVLEPDPCAPVTWACDDPCVQHIPAPRPATVVTACRCEPTCGYSEPSTWPCDQSTSPCVTQPPQAVIVPQAPSGVIASSAATVFIERSYPEWVTEGQTAQLHGRVTSPGTAPVCFEWTAERGSFDDPSSLSPVYTAPAAIRWGDSVCIKLEIHDAYGTRRYDQIEIRIKKALY